MNWCNSSWPNAAHPKTVWDGLTQDQLLVQHQALKDQIETLKKQEMSLRKYIVDRSFPEKHEGTNTVELGNGYELKAKVKFNYKITKEPNELWTSLERIRKCGNKGAFIADRLINWSPRFLVTEYRPLIEDKDESKEAKAILQEIATFLTIEEATPELIIKEPSKK